MYQARIEKQLDRRVACAKYRTQAEVDAAIDRFISLGEKSEAKQDKCEWESKRYWYHHDIAVKWYTRAERLMP